MLAGEAARARAEALLAAHLTPRQRSEYVTTGRISIVKRGFVWSILAWRIAPVLPIAALLWSAEWRPLGVVLLVGAVALAPFWLSRVVLAATRRRTWMISGRCPPLLRARGRVTRFCVRFTEDLPEADRALAWKHMIELSEPHFLRTANPI